MEKSLSQKSFSTFQKFIFALVFVAGNILSSVKTFAQTVPEKVDVDISTNSGGDSVWYGQPWVWAIGIAVFIVIIIAITRSSKNNA